MKGEERCFSVYRKLQKKKEKIARRWEESLVPPNQIVFAFRKVLIFGIAPGIVSSGAIVWEDRCRRCRAGRCGSAVSPGDSPRRERTLCTAQVRVQFSLPSLLRRRAMLCR